MIRISIFLAFIVPLNLFSQNFIITGKVFSYDIKESGKIFYTELGEKYDKNKFVKYEKNKAYTLSINLEKLKKDKTKVLVFTIDTAFKSTCTSKLYVAEILNSPEFSNKQNIKLYSDLLLDRNCTRSTYFDSQVENEQRFVGQYKLQKKDTIFEISLQDEFKKFVSTISKNTSTYMNEEFGYWDFDQEKKKLFIDVSYQTNEKFGLLLNKKFRYEFNVLELQENITFSSKFYNLDKIEIKKALEINKENAVEGEFVGDWQIFNLKNLNYTEELKEEGIKGNVRILFYLLSSGEIGSIELDNNSEQKNQELVRLAKNLIKKSDGKWNVKTKNGLIISGWRYKDIIFRE